MASERDTAVGRIAKVRYWRAADARVVVEAWRRSGEPLSRFADRHGIHPRRLSRWAAELDAQEEAVRFHPVRLLERQERGRPSGGAIEIVLGDSYFVRVPPGFAAEDLERVLSVLALEAPC